MKGNVLKIQINGTVLVDEDAKQFVDYFTDTLIKKHNRALTKRNIYLQTLDVVYKICLIIIVVKFFPGLISLFIR